MGRLARAGTTAWALLGIAAVVFVTAWLVGRLMAVILPFAVALLLATLLRPVAARLERSGLRSRAVRDDRGGARRGRARAARLADLPAGDRPAGRPRREPAGGHPADRLLDGGARRRDGTRGGRPDAPRRGVAPAEAAWRERHGGRLVRGRRARRSGPDRVPVLLPRQGRPANVGVDGRPPAGAAPGRRGPGRPARLDRADLVHARRRLRGDRRRDPDRRRAARRRRAVGAPTDRADVARGVLPDHRRGRRRRRRRAGRAGVRGAEFRADRARRDRRRPAGRGLQVHLAGGPARRSISCGSVRSWARVAGPVHVHSRRRQRPADLGHGSHEPAKPEVSDKPIDIWRNDGYTDYSHDVDEDDEGIAWVSGRGGIRGYATRAPTAIRTRTATARPRRSHPCWWPAAASRARPSR